MEALRMHLVSGLSIAAATRRRSLLSHQITYAKRQLKGGRLSVYVERLIAQDTRRKPRCGEELNHFIRYSAEQMAELLPSS